MYIFTINNLKSAPKAPKILGILDFIIPPLLMFRSGRRGGIINNRSDIPQLEPSRSRLARYSVFIRSKLGNLNAQTGVKDLVK